MSAELDVVNEVAHSVAQSASFIDTLGLNWKLFLAQIVNFSVIVVILWKWAWKPLVKLMDERSAKIEKSLEDAKRIEEELKKANERREAMLLETKKEAQAILATATKHAEALRAEMIAKAKAETEKVVADAKVAIASEKEQMLVDVKGEVAGLVVAATEKILQEKIDTKKDRELVEAVVRTMNK